MKIAVIGAGVIGVSSALALARSGHEVTLYDRSGIASGASGGNAGAFAFSDIIPLATPGIMRKAPKWLLDPNGPLSVPPGYAPRIAPWLLKFWRASWRDRYAAAIAAQSALMTLSGAALDRLVQGHRLKHMLRREGQLQVYEGEAAFRATLPGWEERRRAGIRFELLESREAIAEVQPGLDARFTHAGYTPDWTNVTDPAEWTRTLAEAFTTLGARIVTTDVTGLRPESGGVVLHLSDGPEHVDRALVAAGAFSGRLLAPLGLSLPLETERGYNTTLPGGAFDLRTHVTFADHGFVVSKIGDGVRVGGGVELGGLDAPPRMSRARSLLDKAATFLPGLDTTGGTQWMGFRPSMPDSLPVIGPAPGQPGILLAFGHGHLGLTQSAGTAEIVAALVDGRDPGIDISPYRADRFRGARP